MVKYKTSLFHKQRLERCFNDMLIRTIGVEILLGGELDGELILPTYYRYENEYTDNKYRFAEIRQVLTKSDLLFFQDLVRRGGTMIFESLAKLKEWLRQEIGCSHCDLDPLDSNTINWNYSHYRHNHISS